MHAKTWLFAAVLTAAFCVGWTAPASAQSLDDTVHWKEEWRPMEAIDVSFIVAGGLGSAFSTLVIEQTRPANWRGGILFDDAVGEKLYARSDAGRDRAQNISDIGYLGLLLVVPLVDSTVAWLVHDDPYVAKQVLGIYAETIAITGFIAILVPRVVGRERPLLGDGCFREPSRPDCNPRATVSFPSGHTAMTMASASTMFVHHIFLPLYGGGTGDAIAVSLAGALATTTGIARIAAVKHHTTDVIFGALLGAGLGTTIPYFLHYRTPDGRERNPLTVKSAPYLEHGSAGWMLSVEW